MMQKLLLFLRRCQHPLLMASGTFPVGVVLIASTAPEVLTQLWPVPVLYLLLAWGCLLVPGKRRLLSGILGAALLVLLCLHQLPPRLDGALLLIPALYVFLLMSSLPIGGWPREQELLPGWSMAGTAAHVVTQILVNGARRTGSSVYEPAAPMLLVSFLIFLLMAMLSLNRGSLDHAAQSRRTVPLLMRRQNVLLTLVLLGLAILIAAIPAIGNTLNTLWDLLMKGIMYIAALIVSLFPSFEQEQSGAAAPEASSFGLGETKEPSLLAVILEKVVFVIALIVLVLLVLYFGRMLYKRLKALLLYLWQRLSSFGNAASEDYEDEITDTRDEADTDRTSLFRRLRSRLPLTNETGMNPNQRVRHRYLRLKLKHEEWQRGNTARETLPASAAQVYERARYGAQTLTDDEAERFRTDTRKL